MATEYKLNYTASEINQKLATVDETKNALENGYYTSAEIEGMFEQANSEVEASLATKADLVDGKVPIEQLPDDIGEGFTQIQSDFNQTDSTQPDYIKNKPIYNIIVNQETGKVEQSLDEIVTAAQSGMVPICSGALSLVTDTVIEDGSYTMIQLTMFALPNTVLPVNIYADGTVEMELSDNMQMKSDRVLSISAESTDSEYPTAKAVYDAIQNIDVVSEWKNIQNKPGDVVTTTTEINNSYTTTLGTPSATSPFLIWNNVVKDKQIYDDIQEGTPVKVTYIQNGETGEFDVCNVFKNSTLDTQFGMSSNNTGYYGFINAAQSVEEVLTQGVWTRADSTKLTFTLVFTKSNTTGQSWLTIAAPESLTDITFTIEISTTETESRTIKLSNNAISIDTEPTEGSTNFINSGDLYNIIGDIDTAIAQLESMIGGASA